MRKTYIIAEIGGNHNGDISLAKKLITIAAVAGCDAVKFQKRNCDVCVPDHQKNKEKKTPWGVMTYLEYRNRLEFGESEYNAIDKCCEHYDIHWSASPWDLESLEFLTDYNIPWIKIPSAHLTNYDLVRNSAEWASRRTDRKLIISTGMSSYDEVVDSIKFAQDHCPSNQIVVMHCNSTYPAPLDELNLSCIQTLKNMFPDCTIGYSGHEFRLGTSVAAVYLGAEYIERHITINREMWGTDQLCSVEPQGLIKLVRGIRELETAYGHGQIQLTESEKEVRKRLRG